MSRLGDVYATVGLGSIGAATAAVIYAGTIAIDKDASRTAKQDIASFINRFERDAQISLLTRHLPAIFDYIYGVRHLSVKCAWRSALSTCLFCSILIFAVFSKRPDVFASVAHSFASGNQLASSVGWFLLVLFYGISIPFCVVLPDYLSLWKSRILLRWCCRKGAFIWAVVIGPVDLIFSMLIVLSYLYLIGYVITGSPSGDGTEIPDMVATLSRSDYSPVKPYSFLGMPVVISPALTSIWAFSVLVSAVLTKLLLMLRHPLKILTWLYDVEEHAIKIVGLVLAGVVWLGFLTYAVL